MELLVVLGLISVLIALLMPAIVGVRKQALAAACGANLRSIGQALTMYTQRYGYYPACYLADVPRAYAIWPVRLRFFTGGDQGVFYCPAQDQRCEWRRVTPEPGAPGTANEAHARFGYEVGEPLLDRDGTPFSYGYNQFGANDLRSSGSGGTDLHRGLGDLLEIHTTNYLSPKPREVRANRVIRPAEMIAVADSMGLGFGDFGLEPTPIDPRCAPGVIHNRGANVLFCDGHVQWYRQRDLLMVDAMDRTTYPMRRMWNNDNRLNAGTGEQ